MSFHNLLMPLHIDKSYETGSTIIPKVISFIYFDGILIYSLTWHKHLVHLLMTFEILIKE